MSNKTQKAAEKKTAWVRSKPVFIVFVTLFSLLVVLAFALPRGQDNQQAGSMQSPQAQQNYCLKIDGTCRYNLEAARTPGQQQKGLSDRDALDENAGMIFVFNKPDIQCFWMKDMRFSIDMLWLDQNKTIVKVEQNVSPDTYPKSFCPDQAAQYVIELNAGVAEREEFRVGQRVEF